MKQETISVEENEDIAIEEQVSDNLADYVVGVGIKCSKCTEEILWNFMNGNFIHRCKNGKQGN